MAPLVEYKCSNRTKEGNILEGSSSGEPTWLKFWSEENKAFTSRCLQDEAHVEREGAFWAKCLKKLL